MRWKEGCSIYMWHEKLEPSLQHVLVWPTKYIFAKKQCVLITQVYICIVKFYCVNTCYQNIVKETVMAAVTKKNRGGLPSEK